MGTFKGSTKTPSVELWTLNTLRVTKTAFSIPKRYHEHPHHIQIRAPLGFEHLDEI